MMHDQPRVNDRRRGSWGRALPFGAVIAGVVAVAVSLAAGRGERVWADAGAAAAAGSPVCVAASAHAGGAGGTNWRTDLEVHSVGPGGATFTLQCLVRNQANPSPTTRSYSLAAGKSRRFDDVLLGEFGISSGAAALVVTASTGQIVVTSRTYNLLGAGNSLGLPSGSTFGQFVPGQEELEAIGPGQQGRLIQLSHNRSGTSGFRTNVGLVNATTATITVHVALYRNDGAYLGTVDATLRAKEYTQLDRIYEQVTGSDVGDGYAVLTADGGSARFFAYASVVDNRTGDPVLVPALVRGGGSVAPTPTRTPTRTTAAPTPTRTPTQGTGGNVNLAPYQPSGWSGVVVPSSDQGTTETGFLSEWYDTYVDWAVANWGPSDITSRIEFELRIDGQPYTRWYSEGLRAGYYTSVKDYKIPSGTIAAGWHTLSIVADPDGVISESNEGDNEDGGSFEWSDVVLSAEPASARASGARAAGAVPVDEVRALDAAASSLTAASTRVLIPAAAHASGAGGTNWRTDLEVHNPGATTVTFTVELLKRDQSNGSPSSQSFNLAPGRSVRYDDVLAGLFGFTGAAALRISSSSEVQVTSRTYNLLGAGNSLGLPSGSTFGQFVAGVAETAAIGSGEQGRLIQLSHSRSTTSGYRTNLGLVNAGTSPIHLEVALYRGDGTALGSVAADLPAGGYTQLDKVFERVTGGDVGGGYAIVWTTTAGGRFLAYASVVDNRTGDPVFVPAVKVTAGGTPPTPTRTQPGVTPTPTPTGTPSDDEQPLSISYLITFTMYLFGSENDGQYFLPNLVNQLLDGGIDGMIDDLVDGQPPEVVTRLSDGVRLDYGSGYTLDSGTVVTGSAEIRVSKTVETSSRIAATVSVTTQGLTSDGEPIQVSSFAIGVDVNRRGDGTVYGTVSPSASGHRAGLPWSVSGNTQVDTAVCAAYPIGGTLTGVLDGRTGVATFSPSCDGTYQYTADGLGYYSFSHQVKSCSGTVYGYRNKIAMMAETGTLVVDPSCAGDQGMSRHAVIGSYGPAGATFQFGSDYAPGSIRVTGTFTSTSVQQSSYGGLPLYRGRVEYTITEYNYDGSTKCEHDWVEDNVLLGPGLVTFCGYI